METTWQENFLKRKKANSPDTGFKWCKVGSTGQGSTELRREQRTRKDGTGLQNDQNSTSFYKYGTLDLGLWGPALSRAARLMRRKQ